MEKNGWRLSPKTTTMPTYFQFLTALIFTVISCTSTGNSPQIRSGEEIRGNLAEDMKGIPLPGGFTYVTDRDSLYANWLLNLKLKKNKTVYLYDGSPKSNQEVQYGVLDIDIGKKDLVQCADAAMKLRADFLFENHRYDEIKFLATSGDEICFSKWLNGSRWKQQGAKLVSYNINKDIRNIQQEYNSFMEFVFSYCGTYSLSRQLNVVNNINSIQAGDIFIQGGFPGHAVTIMAVAKDNTGKKIFLLSQGYMPAQDIHILKNYNDNELSPWYDISEIFPLHTPQWQFEEGSLKRW
jgi:hypothetical protein